MFISNWVYVTIWCSVCKDVSCLCYLQGKYHQEEGKLN